jgi:hypothetical protein
LEQKKKGLSKDKKIFSSSDDILYPAPEKGLMSHFAFCPHRGTENGDSSQFPKFKFPCVRNIHGIPEKANFPLFLLLILSRVGWHA